MIYNVIVGVHVRKIKGKKIAPDEEVMPGRENSGLIVVEDWWYYEKAMTFQHLPRSGDTIKLGYTVSPREVRYVIHTPLTGCSVVKPKIILRHEDSYLEGSFRVYCRRLEGAGFQVESTMEKQEEMTVRL